MAFPGLLSEQSVAAACASIAAKLRLRHWRWMAETRLVELTTLYIQVGTRKAQRVDGQSGMLIVDMAVEAVSVLCHAQDRAEEGYRGADGGWFVRMLGEVW